MPPQGGGWVSPWRVVGVGEGPVGGGELAGGACFEGGVRPGGALVAVCGPA